MNSDQRRYEQNNPHISNEIHHNHDASCWCGCQQGKYEQNNEEYQNQNIANEQITQEYDGAYSYHNQGTMYSATDDSMQNDKHCNESCGYNPTQLNTPHLPIESIRFQTITNINTSNGHRVLDASNNFNGSGVPLENVSYACRNLLADNTVLNEQAQFNHESQFFIFYHLDNGNFLIANRGNGRVLQLSPEQLTTWVITSNVYNGTNLAHQSFGIDRVTPDNFRLMIGQRYAVNICAHAFNRFTKVTAVDRGSGTNFLFRFRTAEDIHNIPTFRPPTQLQRVRELTSLDDAGPSQGERAVMGSALIPCILVNDVISLDQRIRQSPYYKLEYRQYWYRTWTDVIPPFTNRPQREEFGIGGAAQGDMRHTVDISIGSDFNLRFGNRSSPFLQQITRGLNLFQSSTNSDLGQKEVENDLLNSNSWMTRFSVFRKAHEFVLTRADGTTVGSTQWNAVDDRNIMVRTFPTNSVLTIENQKIIKADNSYDLSVFKTPLIIKDGEIKNKNKEYPCDE